LERGEIVEVEYPKVELVDLTWGILIHLNLALNKEPSDGMG
jgi:hypothetical protein